MLARGRGGGRGWKMSHPALRLISSLATCTQHLSTLNGHHPLPQPQKPGFEPSSPAPGHVQATFCATLPISHPNLKRLPLPLATFAPLSLPRVPSRSYQPSRVTHGSKIQACKHVPSILRSMSHSHTSTLQHSHSRTCAAQRGASHIVKRLTVKLRRLSGTRAHTAYNF